MNSCAPSQSLSCSFVTVGYLQSHRCMYWQTKHRQTGLKTWQRHCVSLCLTCHSIQAHKRMCLNTKIKSDKLQWPCWNNNPDKENIWGNNWRDTYLISIVYCSTHSLLPLLFIFHLEKKLDHQCNIIPSEQLSDDSHYTRRIFLILSLEWMLLRKKQEGEKYEKRMGAVEDIQWKACVQLFPQGNVDPSGNLLLADCRRKIALARHCKYSMN